MMNVNKLGMMVGELVMVVKTPFLIYSKSLTINSPDPIGTLFFCTGISDIGRGNFRIQIINGEMMAQLDPRDVVCVKNNEFLSGYHICMTGSSSRFSKAAVKLIIESLGGLVVSSPKKATHILQGNIENSIKLNYAETKGIPVMNFDQFKTLVESVAIWL